MPRRPPGPQHHSILRSNIAEAERKQTRRVTPSGQPQAQARCLASVDHAQEAIEMSEATFPHGGLYTTPPKIKRPGPINKD